MDPQREAAIARAWGIALQGGELGIRRFSMQWLNVWPTADQTSARWLAASVTTRAAGRVGDAPAEALAAIESTPGGESWAVALAWPWTKGRTRSRVWIVPTLADALRAAGDRRVWAHQAVTQRPELVRRGSR